MGNKPESEMQACSCGQQAQAWALDLLAGRQASGSCHERQALLGQRPDALLSCPALPAPR